MRRFAGRLLMVGLIFILLGLYWYGAMEQFVHVNKNLAASDQSAYMEYAQRLYQSGYTYIGDYNRMPVYPFLQSLIYRPGMPDKEFFALGKYLNLVLSLVLLAALAFIVRRYVSWLTTLNLMLITAFTVFIFKAPWFQAELLFYFINFVLFLLMWQLLQRPAWRLAIATGIVAGVAHLTKASILPGLALFLVLAAWRGAWALYQNRRSVTGAVLEKSILPHLAVVLLVGVFFLATVFPYINTSKQVFGRYFYNVNSTFYIWYDSWEQAKQGTRAHGDRVGWPDMPPEELPSLSKYLREHTTDEIIQRFVDGGQRTLTNMQQSYGYFKYIVIYLGLLGVAAIWNWREAYRIVTSKPVACLFVPMYFAAYFMLYAWYVPIAQGNRFALGQFLPLMLVLSLGIRTLSPPLQIRVGQRTVRLWDSAGLLVLAVIVVDIYLVLTQRIGTMPGGK